MIDCKGRKLMVGDIVKYRSVYSDFSSRSRKIYVAKVLNTINSKFLLLKGDTDACSGIEIELSGDNLRCAAIEKISNEKAMLWILENV